MVFYLILFFILGSAIGSFLNVVIDRTVRGERLTGRSYCDHCRATLGTIDLVPIVSFVGLSGKCRFCKRPISWQYPAVEALTAILFAYTFYFLASSGAFSVAAFVYSAIIISVLLIVAVVDIKFSLVPTTFVLTGAIIALFYDYFNLSSGEFVVNVFVAAVLALAFLLVVVLTRGRGMGSGDIPLVFLIGLFLPWPKSTVAIFLAFLAGAIVAVLLLVGGKKKFGQTIPFAPFLALGTIIALFWGEQLLDWYLGLF